MRASTRLHVFSLCALVICSLSSTLRAQQQPYSSSAEYQTMLHELRDQPIRPSKMMAGTLSHADVPLIALRSHETKMMLQLESDAFRLEIRKDLFQLTLTNKRTMSVWKSGGPDAAALTWKSAGNAPSLHLANVEQITRSGDKWQLRVRIDGSSSRATIEIAALSPTILRLSIRASQLANDSRLAMSFHADGPFFGLGERFVQAKLDGSKVKIYPEDLPGRPGHNWTYIPVPFLLTPHGMGMYLDTARVSDFDLTDAQHQRFSIDIDDRSADAYFFIDDAPKKTVEDYTSLTGRTPLSAPWTYGVWICAYQGPDSVMKIAHKLRDEKVPSSALWVFDVMGKGDIEGWPLWWTGYYPDIHRFTGELHGMGFKVLTYVHAYLRQVLDPYNLPNPNFDEAKQKGWFVRNAAGEPTGVGFEPFIDGDIDFTNPQAVDWWQDRVRNVLVNEGFDGWMEDFGEWKKTTDRYTTGDARDMVNLYPLFYHKITYEVSRAAKRDEVEFDRSGYAGSQAYTPVVWGGDQSPDWKPDYGLPSLIAAGTTAGLSGFSVWGPDIDENTFSKELWMRWVEFGALTPIMRTHPWDKPNGAINWMSDAQTIAHFRRYAGLHVSLFPYLYTFAQEATKDGVPIMRHPLLEFPNDAKSYDAENEYLLGDKMLVAPVITEGATSRSLYLPPGAWADYGTGELLQGGREVTVAAPLDQIPIFVRAGSIIPMIDPETQTLADESKLTSDLIWRVLPASAATQDTFTMYDGSIATVSQDSAGISVRAHATQPRRSEVLIPVKGSGCVVTQDGRALNELSDSERKSGKSGWFPEQTDGSVHIALSEGTFEVKVTGCH